LITPCHTQALVANGIGLALELCYVLMFITFAHERTAMALAQSLLCIVAFGLMLVAGLLVAPRLPIATWQARGVETSSQTFVIGLFSGALSVGMYASPLSVMGEVIRTESVEFLPFPLIAGTLLTAGLWAAWGFVAMDVFVLVPNGIGFLLGLGQLMLYCFYSRSPAYKKGHSTSRDDDQMFTSGPRRSIPTTQSVPFGASCTPSRGSSGRGAQGSRGRAKRASAEESAASNTQSTPEAVRRGPPTGKEQAELWTRLSVDKETSQIDKRTSQSAQSLRIAHDKTRTQAAKPATGAEQAELWKRLSVDKETSQIDKGTSQANEQAENWRRLSAES